MRLLRNVYYEYFNVHSGIWHVKNELSELSTTVNIVQTCRMLGRDWEHTAIVEAYWDFGACWGFGSILGGYSTANVEEYEALELFEMFVKVDDCDIFLR